VTVQFLGPEPLETEIQEVLSALAAGVRVETEHVDVKEEAGRRTADGSIRPGNRQNDRAAQSLAGAVACMANTPGGGALVVGAADDGTLIGTELDAGWLRHRLYDMTTRRVTVDIQEVIVNSHRILVLKVVEGLEPIAYGGRITWRVDRHCVEIDSATLLSGRLYRLGNDSTAGPSGYRLEDVRPVAVQRARDYLRASGESQPLDLANASDNDLLRRLNAVNGDGALTGGGALMFVGRDEPGLDYIRRTRSGGDSTMRIQQQGTGLLEELYEVERAIAASNPVVHRGSSLAQGQLRELPDSAIREAIVNGIAHRDWQSPSPTLVEHVGASLTVTSPGGFVGGVTPDNIITHPSETRNRALAEMLSSLRIAEREGVGVDRMVRDMIRVGLKGPVIQETPGPYVRTALVGGQIDEEWISFLNELHPVDLGSSLDALLLLDRLVRKGWLDVESSAPDLQRSRVETRAAIGDLARGTVGGSLIIQTVDAVPAGQPTAWRLTDAVRERLAPRLEHLDGTGGRANIAEEYALLRGRISSSELAELSGVAVNNAGATLRHLEDNGILAPGRENRLGRGFYFIPVGGLGKHRAARSRSADITND
jgi:ATP-dependent DNA helicase RecG